MSPAGMHPTLLRQLRRRGLDPSQCPTAADWRWLLERVSVAYGDADNDRYTLERAIQISTEEMTALHRELARREQLQARILETAAEGIITIGDDGRVQSFNAAAEAMFGWDSDEIIGRSLTVLMPPESRMAHQRGLYRAAGGGSSELMGRSVEVIGMRRDGSRFPMRLSISHVRVGDEQSFAGIVRDLSQESALRAQLEHQASHDSLTGLPNRACFLHELGDALQRGSEVSLLFVDLDHFKVINDSLGHDVGDHLLREVAARLRAIVRQKDEVARLGGDEFVVLCCGRMPREVLERVAARIGASLARPFTVDGHEVVVSASVGIATGAHTDAGALLRSADLAMYRAKHSGRNGYSVYDTELQAWAEARRSVERDLRQAVADREMVVHFQPIVHLRSGTTLGAEALVRWDRPGHGLVPASAFLDVAEETGLIGEIGQFVVSESVAAVSRWRAASGRPVYVSVNVAARQLAKENVAERLSQLLHSYDLEPSAVMLELAEATMVSGEGPIRVALSDLEELGTPMAIDDFGKGWSSLVELRRLPASTLKIDRSFVEDIDRDPAAAAILGAVVDMAHAVGADVIAQGVERESQAEILVEHGCDAAQGELFGLPQMAFDASATLHPVVARRRCTRVP